VITIVAGELAKSALQHGYEGYGINIIDRLIAIAEKFDDYLPCVMQPDGSKGHGIPDNWGQAAVASALIEGLAGVVDEGSGFQKITISPRWSYTDLDNLKIILRYGPSGKWIAYKYQKKEQEISLGISGDAEEIRCRILLPKGVHTVKADLNGKPVQSNIEKIRNSHYAVIEGLKGENQTLIVRW
jgi:hypothetical protein